MKLPEKTFGEIADATIVAAINASTTTTATHACLKIIYYHRCRSGHTFF